MIHAFKNITGTIYKISIQKLVVFQCTNINLTRKKLVFKNPFHDGFTNVFSNAPSEGDEMLP